MRKNVPQKATSVLHFFIVLLVLIGVRVGHLTLFKHDEYEERARKPQRREVMQAAHRGSICDRFGKPLAINQQEYQIAILYDAIRAIPRVKWDRSGKKPKKQFARRDYIEQLSKLLGDTLNQDPLDIEDRIYSYAALFPSRPYLLQGNLSESLYYRLKALEREYPGIHMQRIPKRYYPGGPVGCDVIGYMGAINRPRLFAITHEIKELKTFLKEREEGLTPPLPKNFTSVKEVCQRISELEERAYSQNSFIGRSGAEGRFEEALRGRVGQTDFEVDREGRYIRKLPGEVEADAGERISLSLSADLQEYAEKLLAYSEAVREERFVSAGKQHAKVPAPWIKGGAIIAMIPTTGEVVALASYPRYDPNDFIQKNTPNIHKWLESPTYTAQIWNGERDLEREFYSMKKKEYYTQSRKMTWEFFLERVFSTKSPLKEKILSLTTMQEVFELQEKEEIPLLSLLVKKEEISEELRSALSLLSPSEYRALCQIKVCLEKQAKEAAKKEFHIKEFRNWRDEHFAAYLKEKRAIEKENKQVERPFLDYLKSKERSLFSAFWEENKIKLLLQYLSHTEEAKAQQLLQHLQSLPEDLQKESLQAMRSFEELPSNLQKLAGHFAKQPFGYLSSYGIHQATPQGSIFKLVTAYEAMRQQLLARKEVNPLTLIDDYRPYQKTQRGPVLGFTTKGEKITRRYRGGTLPRSRLNIGRIDIESAIERSSNLYFSLLAGDILKEPTDLIAAAKEFGFGKRTGIELPGEYRGILPRDLRDNRTGLYSLAIGQHTLSVTPIQTAQMLSTIANGGQLLKPQIIYSRKGEKKENRPFTAQNYLYQEELQNIGITFPLFTQTSSEKTIPYLIKSQPEIKHELYMPEALQKTLLKGMANVVQGEKGSARPSRIRTLYEHAPFLRNYLALKHQLAGKTSTAEFIYRPTLDREEALKCKDIWFGGISYNPDFDHPELVVVVYLRFGDYGKEAAPLASEIIQKWRELQKSAPLL
ncbi:MAG: penicillin-binding transpeptidase domain-containing protein [Candidatus Algichlamydia australiensis]|nr:penicillin-binding transpeptidase domain-containing protein [Chlamydiales bacterium]